MGYSDLAAPAKRRQVARHTGVNDPPDPLDAVVILIEPLAPAQARYRGSLRAAALTMAEGLSQDAVGRVRQLRAVIGVPLSQSSFGSVGGPRAGGLADQVVALGGVRRAPGGLDVRRGGSGQVAVELVQVAADGMPPVAVAEHLAQPIGLEQPRGGTEDVADRDRAAEPAAASRRTGSSVRATRSSYQARSAAVGLVGAGRRCAVLRARCRAGSRMGGGRIERPLRR